MLLKKPPDEPNDGNPHHASDNECSYAANGSSLVVSHDLLQEACAILVLFLVLGSLGVHVVELYVQYMECTYT